MPAPNMEARLEAKLKKYVDAQIKDRGLESSWDPSFFAVGLFLLRRTLSSWCISQ
jgi:hypothetical protein